MIKYKVIFTIIVLVSTLNIGAQEDILKYKISIAFNNITKHEALKNIEQTIGMYFTFKEGLSNNGEIIHASYQDVSLEEILSDLFKSDELNYLLSGNLIIVRKSHNSINKSCKSVVPILCNSHPPVKLSHESHPYELIKLEPLEAKIIQIKNQHLLSNESVEFEMDVDSYHSDSNDSVCKTNTNKFCFNNKKIFSSYLVIALQKKQRISRIVTKSSIQNECIKDKVYCEDDIKGSCESDRKRCRPFKTGISISPHFTFYSGDSNIGYGIYGGLDQDIWYKNSIAFHTGLQFSAQKISVFKKQQESNFSPREITIYYLIVPSCISLTVYSGQRSKYYLSGGLYHYFFSNKDISIDRKDTSMEWLQYVYIGFGIERSLSKNFNWHVEPFYRFPLNKGTTYQPYSKTGVTIRISFSY